MSDEPNNDLQRKRPKIDLLIGSFLAGAIVTLFVGFGIFDWYTHGNADNMAEAAAAEARAEFAGAICVERFMTGENVAQRLEELKNEGEWDRDNYIEDGGWATFATTGQPLNGAASRCADTLVEMQMPEGQATSG
jgi:hypothetical protein